MRKAGKQESRKAGMDRRFFSYIPEFLIKKSPSLVR
jgi:hypothetical protein